MSALQRKYWSCRRWLLRTFVPEFVWQREAVIDGVVFKVRNTPYSFGTKKALQNGNYELSERQLLKGEIRPGDVIIEMGGSIGVLTAILAHQAGDTGQVISVEASKKITAYSKAWLEAKGNIKVITGFGFPVFAVNNTIKLIGFDEEGGSLGGTLHFDLLAHASHVNDDTIFDIQKIMQQLSVSPTVLVADVEGSERILAAVKPLYPLSVRLVLMELHEHLYGPVIRDEIINAITVDGFTVKHHVSGVYLFERKQPFF